MRNNRKIGLITYHSAYNFGSVLQAYATQEAIKEIAGNCEVLNYRSKEQKRVYSIFKWDRGLKGMIKSGVKNVLMLRDWRTQKVRMDKYERVISELFALSKEVTAANEVSELWNQYDLIVSGSDQIWNKHSNELEHVGWDEMAPYLLRGYKGKKVSYASSLTNMTDEEISKIIADISEFDAISFREQDTYHKMKNDFMISCENVLDPTFLLSKEAWKSKLNLSRSGKENYLLYYALNKRSEIKAAVINIKKYARKHDLQVKMIAPLNYIGEIADVEILKDVDPIDFMNLILNASTVVTDSYHGTILSVNLGKDIYSICKGHPSDFRKVNILSQLGMADRIIRSTEELLMMEYAPINYHAVNKQIESRKEKSICFLADALRS